MSTSTKPKTVRDTLKVSIAGFDTSAPFDLKWDAVPIGEVGDFTNYWVSGGTPLRDATMRMIGHLDGLRRVDPDNVQIGILLDQSGSMAGQEVGVRQSVNEFITGMRGVEPSEDGGKVLCVIITDGYENSSREVTAEQLRVETDRRQKEGWRFIYMGSDQDAWSNAIESGMSVTPGSTVNYTKTARGTSSAMGRVSSMSQSYLSSDAATFDSVAASLGNTVTEDGQDVQDNTKGTAGQPWDPNKLPNSPLWTPGQPSPPQKPVTPKSYGNVADALKQATDKPKGKAKDKKKGD